MVKIFSSMIAAMGRQLKQSVNVFQSLILYRRLPGRTQYVNTCMPIRLSSRGRGRGRTFVVKAVNSVDGGALVVAAKDEKVFGVLDLVCEEKTNGLERLFASIDIVAEKEVVCFWGEAAIFKQTEEVVVLAVDVACVGASRQPSVRPVSTRAAKAELRTTDLDGCF
jgi:hypothetical protein